jgi:hypothetical protein
LMIQTTNTNTTTLLPPTITGTASTSRPSTIVVPGQTQNVTVTTSGCVSGSTTKSVQCPSPDNPYPIPLLVPVGTTMLSIAGVGVALFVFRKWLFIRASKR